MKRILLGVSISTIWIILVVVIQLQKPKNIQAQVQPSRFVVNDVNNGSPISVDSTSGGTLVANGNSGRASMTILNSGSNTMNCAPSTLVVDSVTGFPIVSGAALSLGPEGKQEWKCFSGSSTTAIVAEGIQ